jgi:uncharacterized tellurite resistance protein B-like protein
MSMIAAIRQFLSDLTAGTERLRFGEEEYRLAAAALLFHAVAIDGVVAAEERAKLAELLERRFELDRVGIDALIAAAETADREAVDLYGFTSVLKGRLDEADREKIVEMMWELAFADGKLHEFEDNLIWRVAELLAVPSRARIRLKQAARERAQA